MSQSDSMCGFMVLLFRWYRRLEYGLVEIIAYSDASSVDGMFLRNSALVINNAKESHSGIYTCNATNALGNDAMEVSDHFYPYILKSSLTIISAFICRSKSM